MLGVLRRLWSGDSPPSPVVTPAGFSGGTVPPVDPPDVAAPPPVVAHDLDAPNLQGRGFIIGYRDAQAEWSERRIVCHAVYIAEGVVYLRARCLERQAARTFRVDRIEEVFCGITGEDLGAPAALFLATETRAVPRPAGRKAMSPEERRVRAALRVLMTVSRCDGSTSPGEGDVIHRFVRQNAPADKTTQEVAAMFDWAMGRQPDFRAFMEDMSDLARDDADLAVRTIQAAVDIVMADGQMGPEEQAVMDDIAWIATASGLPVTFETYST